MSTSSDIRLPFAAIVLAMLPAVLDQTILATALPTIASDLGKVTQVSWLVTVYVVCATAATPLWGKLADRRGRKGLLQLALAVFVGRLRGCAGRPGHDAVADRARRPGRRRRRADDARHDRRGRSRRAARRGRYQGYISMVFAGATVLGPLIGGVLTDWSPGACCSTSTCRSASPRWPH